MITRLQNLSYYKTNSLENDSTNVTIRQEYVKCGNPDCQYGPYLYAYWKQDKKLNKGNVGKNLEDFGPRNIAK